MIDRNISIEELVVRVPDSVRYLMQNGIKCLACGEPVWGTLASVAEEKGIPEEAIERFVRELNELPPA
ncbi:MAG: DUF1858 domain-containing protein [Bacteroidetes bacterium]|nr:MAG: DUF1858 domain-containing protein [Bacteroidota bacterium]